MIPSLSEKTKLREDPMKVWGHLCCSEFTMKVWSQLCCDKVSDLPLVLLVPAVSAVLAFKCKARLYSRRPAY